MGICRGVIHSVIGGTWLPWTSSSAIFGHDLKRAGIWEDMTLVLSSDNGYKASETHIKWDPELRVPLIVKIGGAPEGHVFRERSSAIRIREMLRWIFAVDAKRTADLACYFQAAETRR